MSLTRKTPLRMTRAAIDIKPKRRKCKQCRTEFFTFSSFVKWCSPECGADLAMAALEKQKAAAAKAERKELKARKEAVKPTKELAEIAQAAVNAYVRVRDYDEGCISCDRDAFWEGQWHASHYKSRGANSFLRFHLWNLHKACSICNHHLSGNIGEYARRLPERIGADRFEYVETAPRQRDYDPDYLRRITAVFNKKTRRLKKRRGIK